MSATAPMIPHYIFPGKHRWSFIHETPSTPDQTTSKMLSKSSVTSLHQLSDAKETIPFTLKPRKMSKSIFIFPSISELPTMKYPSRQAKGGEDNLHDEAVTLQKLLLLRHSASKTLLLHGRKSSTVSTIASESAMILSEDRVDLRKQQHMQQFDQRLSASSIPSQLQLRAQPEHSTVAMNSQLKSHLNFLASTSSSSRTLENLQQKLKKINRSTLSDCSLLSKHDHPLPTQINETDLQHNAFILDKSITAKLAMSNDSITLSAQNSRFTDKLTASAAAAAKTKDQLSAFLSSADMSPKKYSQPRRMSSFSSAFQQQQQISKFAAATSQLILPAGQVGSNRRLSKSSFFQQIKPKQSRVQPFGSDCGRNSLNTSIYESANNQSTQHDSCTIITACENDSAKNSRSGSEQSRKHEAAAPANGSTPDLNMITFDEETLVSGEITSSIEDKFRLFSGLPVNCQVIIRTRRPIQSQVYSAFSMNRLPNAPSSLHFPNSPKNAQRHRRDSKSFNQSSSPLNIPSSMNIAAIGQKQQMLRISPRISNFFRDQLNCTHFLSFVTNCRALKQNIDKLQKLETNKNKTVSTITRFVSSKPYLVQTIINTQFAIIQQEFINTLENNLISETFLRTYFRTDDSLKAVVSDTYVKDIAYINSLLEDYINRRQTHAAEEISQSIQKEYKLVKQKEKSIIIDSLANSSAVAAASRVQLAAKRQYPFFNDYLYNVLSHRNTFQEILEFEAEFGTFDHLTPVERETYVNLDKSYAEIRQHNQP